MPVTTRSIRASRAAKKRLNLKCTIQSRKLHDDTDVTLNSHGEIDYSLDSNWRDDGTGFFHIEQRRAMERESGEQLIGIKTFLLTTRYSSVAGAIQPEQRIIRGTRKFHVVGVQLIDEDQPRFVEVECVEEA